MFILLKDRVISQAGSEPKTFLTQDSRHSRIPVQLRCFVMTGNDPMPVTLLSGIPTSHTAHLLVQKAQNVDDKL